jgi:hypothetical protein
MGRNHNVPNAAGNRTSRWGSEPSLTKSSRVYVREGGQWKLVHANFAPVASGH